MMELGHGEDDAEEVRDAVAVQVHVVLALRRVEEEEGEVRDHGRVHRPVQTRPRNRRE